MYCRGLRSSLSCCRVVTVAPSSEGAFYKLKIMKITWERLTEVLHYNPESGEFTWLKSLSNRVKVGAKANNVSPTNGTIRIRIDGQLYEAHILAWFYQTKQWPKCLIDHRNGKRADNWFDNLREADHAQNSHNYGAKGEFGKGVERAGDKFRARIMVRGKRLNLGRFDTAELAQEAYKQASLKHHGEFSPFILGNNNG